MLTHKIPPAFVAIILAALGYIPASFVGGVALSVYRPLLFIGIAIMIAACVLLFASIYQFIKFATTVDPTKPSKASALVTTGVYRFSRNPMYLAFSGILVSAALISNLPALVLSAPLFILYMNKFQIGPEEDIMAAKFGESFVDYKRKVRRWL
ncbi:MAG: isoprenylcysteine carboxylmethyltransferase family protein [Cellvibrionaceae bacterium]|nr:isoprenylcysteine carboxylmethyltransferase family protein [Cellvibrionaceae bacterium]